MREHRETISCRGTSAITAVTRSLMFMLVFCFAGCAAGSCLSYGHSCWGAHGKRSGHNNNNNNNNNDNYPGNNVGNEEASRQSLSAGNNNAGVNENGESLQDQWILSRLVTRQLNSPTGEKLRGHWHDYNRARGRGRVHERERDWDSNDIAVGSDTAKSLRRDEVQIDDDDEEDEIRDEVIPIVPRVISRETQEQILEPRSDITEDDELVLVPPSENHLKPIGQAHKLRLFKILNGETGKLK